MPLKNNMGLFSWSCRALREFFRLAFFKELENTIAAGNGIFSLLVLALSITSNIRTGLRNSYLCIIVFALFAIQQFFDYFENLIPESDVPLSGILLDSLALTILVLFFLTIVRTGNS